MLKEILISTALIIILVLFFSFKAGEVGSQFTGDENFYFQSAKNMLKSGDFLTPRYYGKPRFQKPILYYWLIVTSFKAFRIDWYAARFPSILLGALTALLVYLIAQRLFKKRSISVLSAFILATTFKFFKYARFAIPDMTLLCFMTLSFYIFIRLLEDGNKKFLWIAFFFTLALSTLTKGPVGIIIPILAIALFIFFSKERLPIKKADMLLGVLLYFALTLPWFLIMLKLHGGNFVSAVWIREIAHRVGYYADSQEGIFRFTEYLGTLFFYIPILIIRFLPWSIFLPAGLFNSFSAARSNAGGKRLHILLLSWFFAVFVFFTIMGEKHSQYMLGLSPPFALIVGGSFFRGLEFSKKRLVLPIAVLLITASSFLSFLTSEEFKLNNAILGGFASRMLSFGLDQDNRVGLGSHQLIPQQLEVYLDRPIKKIGGKWYGGPSENERVNKMRLKDFFASKKGVFCIIGKKDFLQYVSPEVRKTLKIIHKDFMWKRKIRITKESLTLLFKGKIGPFFNSFKEEYYLVTDR